MYVSPFAYTWSYLVTCSDALWERHIFITTLVAYQTIEVRQDLE